MKSYQFDKSRFAQIVCQLHEPACPTREVTMRTIAGESGISVKTLQRMTTPDGPNTALSQIEAVVACLQKLCNVQGVAVTIKVEDFLQPARSRSRPWDRLLAGPINMVTHRMLTPALVFKQATPLESTRHAERWARAFLAGIWDGSQSKQRFKDLVGFDEAVRRGGERFGATMEQTIELATRYRAYSKYAALLLPHKSDPTKDLATLILPISDADAERFLAGELTELEIARESLPLSASNTILVAGLAGELRQDSWVNRSIATVSQILMAWIQVGYQTTPIEETGLRVVSFGGNEDNARRLSSWDFMLVPQAYRKDSDYPIYVLSLPTLFLDLPRKSGAIWSLVASNQAAARSYGEPKWAGDSV